MGKRRHWLFIIVVGAGLAGFAAFVVLLAVTEARRSRAVARVVEPKAIEAYAVIAAQRNGGGSRSRSAEGPAKPPLPRAVQASRESGGREDSTALTTLASFDRLFERYDEAIGNNAAWKELRREVLKFSVDEWTDAQRRLLLDFVAEHSGLIAEIRRAAELGGPVYPLELSVPYSEVKHPHLEKMAGSASLLCADAIAQGLQGNQSGAVEDVLAALQLSDVLEGEPLIVSQLCRYRMDGMAASAIAEAFEWAELPADAAQDLLVELNQGRGAQALADALGGEQTMVLALFADMTERAAGVGVGNWLSRAIRGTEQEGDLGLYSTSLARPWRNLDQLFYMDALEDIREAALLPYYEARPMLDVLKGELDVPARTHPISSIMLPGIVNLQQARARNESVLDVARVGIALELHYQERGAYPDRLDAVASYLGESVPVDTLTGKPFHYTPQGDRFLLYSVGQNLTDEGGVPGGLDGDIVWRGRAE